MMRVLATTLVLLDPGCLSAAPVLLPALGPVEGQAVIYSSLDLDMARPILLSWQHGRPDIAIEYHEMLTGQIQDRVIRESDSGGRTADLVFSSAMDLQVKLTNDGYGARVVTPATADWPDWAMWRETAYALTYEPAVLAWHKPAFANLSPPRTRAELLAWLRANPQDARTRVGSYDVTRSGVGYLLLARDQDLFPGIWDVMAAGAGPVHPTTGDIMERIVTGDLVLGYNLLGSYVAQWARDFPDQVGMSLPQDFTIVVSRVALVPRAAGRADLGADLLGWLMSDAGQAELSSHLHLPAVSLGVTGDADAGAALVDLAGLRLDPVPVGPGLLAYLDQATRAGLIARWHAAREGRD